MRIYWLGWNFGVGPVDLDGFLMMSSGGDSE
jgi:hypothetical protein